MKLLALLIATAAFAQQPSIRVLVAYHSETGNTARLAQDIGSGAGIPGMNVQVKRVTDVSDEEIRQADGIVVGTPVQWSNMSAETKRFLDRVGKVLWDAKSNGDGRTAGAFCTGGGVSMGKDSARLSILEAFLTMRFVIVGGVDAVGFGTAGASATTGPDDPGISDKERKEARQFGRRFAEMTRAVRR